MTADRASIRADVFVIGGGLAGLRAAAAARRAGRDVVIASRGRIGAGGCSVRASGGFAAATDPADTPRDHCVDTLSGGYGIGERELIRRMTEEAPARLRELAAEVDGFARHDGRLRGAPAPVHGYPRSVQYLPGMPRLLASLRDQLERAGVRVLDRQRCVRLDREAGGRVRGLWLFDERTLALRYGSAGAVVLAGGGCGRLYPVTSNGPDATGDAFALALDAGCALRDMEFIQFTPTAFAAPESVRGRTIVGTLLTLPGVVLTNSKGERFMGRYDPDRMERADRATLARAVAEEVLAGRGSPNGGVFLDLRSVPSAELDRHRPGFHEFCREAGLNPATEFLETAPSAHTCLGGVAVDGEMRACEGLYAAGEAAGGVHGANRLSSNSLIDALVGGWRAGKSAAASCVKPVPEPAGEAPPLPARGQWDPAEPLADLRRVMGDRAGVVRSGEGLSAGLGEVAEIGKSMQSLAGRGVTDPGKWLDLLGLIATAEGILTASLMREESRGAHCRRDFPTPDENAWIGSIHLTRHGGKLSARFHSIDNAN